MSFRGGVSSDLDPFHPTVTLGESRLTPRASKKVRSIRPVLESG